MGSEMCIRDSHYSGTASLFRMTITVFLRNKYSLHAHAYGYICPSDFGSFAGSPSERTASAHQWQLLDLNAFNFG